MFFFFLSAAPLSESRKERKGRRKKLLGRRKGRIAGGVQRAMVHEDSPGFKTTNVSNLFVFSMLLIGEFMDARELKLRMSCVGACVVISSGGSNRHIISFPLVLPRRRRQRCNNSCGEPFVNESQFQHLFYTTYHSCFFSYTLMNIIVFKHRNTKYGVMLRV